MDEVMVVVSCVLLTTVVARVAPLKITTEEETKWLPVAVRIKRDGNCAKSMLAGEIESSTGAGRALPQRGFSDLHPSGVKAKSKRTTSGELTSAVRNELGTS